MPLQPHPSCSITWISLPSADGYAVWAQVLIYLGEPEEALRKTQEAINRNPKYSFVYDYRRGHAYYVWGFLTKGTDVNASHQYYQKAEEYLREALKKNPNFRPARAYLVAVLSELGQRMGEEGRVNEAQALEKQARDAMAILRDGGRPQAFQDLNRFEAYVRRGHPFQNPAIKTRLRDLWQAAESQP